MTEEKESLTMTYEVGNFLPWADIRREKKELLFAALIDVGKLEEKAKIYRFTLAPENLYYDIQGRVYVKARDVYGADGEFREEDFLREYKSLIGCTLVKKYKFEDYDEGAESTVPGRERSSLHLREERGADRNHLSGRKESGISL